MDMFPLELVGGATGTGALILAWLLNRGKANSQQIDDLETRVDGLNDRTTKIEGQIGALPSHEDLQLLHGRISDVKDDVGHVAESLGEVKGELKAGNRIMGNILEALLQERNTSS